MRRKFRGFAEDDKNTHDYPFDEEPIEGEGDSLLGKDQSEDDSLPDEEGPEKADQTKMGWLSRKTGRGSFE